MRTKALPALLALSLLAPATESRADPADAKKGAAAPKSDEASERFRSGVAFYKDKDFTAALVEFKKAYELAPNYRVLYNLGQTGRELKDYAAALAAFERYLREGGQEIPPARRKDVQASVDELKRKVGRIKVSTNVEGAEILLDDLSLGTAPLAEPVIVNVGRRKFAASLAGYTPVQRVVEVSGMQEDTVTLELTRIEKPRAALPDAVKTKVLPVKTETPIAAWAMVAVTGASAVVTGVMGGLALSARGSLKKELGTFPGNATAIADAQSRTKSFALGADIAAGVTLAGAITTTVLFLVAPRGEPEKAPPRASVDISPTGLVVRGVF